MSEKTSKPRPKWYTAYILVVLVFTIILGISLIILKQTTIEKGIFFLSLALVAECIAYYGRVKPSLSLNRVMYILIGMPIGFVIWWLFMFFSVHSIGYSVNENFVYVVGSLGICFLIGGIIGDFIGRLRHYKGPEQYQI